MNALVGSTFTPSYAVSIARKVVQEDYPEISREKIQMMIQEQAVNDQGSREIETGRKWRDYEKKKGSKTFMFQATRKTVQSMVKWGLLEVADAKSSLYRPTDDMKDLGSIGQKDEQSAIAKLYVLSMRGGPSATLSPIHDLIPIRENEIAMSEPMRQVGLPTKEVVILDSSIRNVLARSLFDSEILAQWGQYYALLNIIDFSVVNHDYAPQMHLTTWVSTIAELQGETDSKTATTHRRAILKALNLSSWNEQAAALLRKRSLALRTIVVSEDNKNWSKDDPYVGFPEKVSVIVQRLPSRDDFRDSLKIIYNYLLSLSPSQYVWITALRALVCRRLMVSERTFDDLLVAFYNENPDRIEFSTTAGSLSRKLRRFDKAFSLYGQRYRMVRLES